MLNELRRSESSVLEEQQRAKPKSMKKAKTELNDWGRSEYKRSDLGELVRGKYAKRLSESIIVLLDPEVAKAFPNSEAVNNALRSLMTKPVRTKRKKSTATRKSKAA